MGPDGGQAVATRAGRDDALGSGGPERERAGPGEDQVPLRFRRFRGAAAREDGLVRKVPNG